MFVRKVSALAVAGLATVALSMSPAAAGYQASGRYVGGTVAGGLPDSGPSFTVGGPNIGGVWFAVPSGSTLVDAAAVDDYSDAVAVDLVFVIDEYGPLAQSKRFCNSATGIPIPTGTKALYVRLKGPSSLACPSGGPPTTGTASVTFN